MDVKLAYLHGVLDEEIYMEQLEGFIAKGEENKVCQLVRSLYDAGVYVLNHQNKGGNTEMILILYVDDYFAFHYQDNSFPILHFHSLVEMLCNEGFALRKGGTCGSGPRPWAVPRVLDEVWGPWLM